MHFSLHYPKFILVAIMSLLTASCHVTETHEADGPDPILDPCGTVVEMFPVNDDLAGQIRTSDCRLSAINPSTSSMFLVDEYRISTSGGPLEIEVFSGVFKPAVFLFSQSCRRDCIDLDAYMLAAGFYKCSLYKCSSRINIDVLPGTYYVLVRGPASVEDYLGYTIHT